MATFPCSFCSGEFSAPSEKLLLTHIRLVHSHDPDFCIQCSFSGCSRTFKNFRTYQNHRLKHNQCEEAPSQRVDDIAEGDPDEDDINEGGEGDEAMFDDEPTVTDMQLYAAKWILKTRETRSLTRSATQGVLEDVQDLISFVTQTLESQTHAILQANGIDPSTVSGLSDVFSGPSTQPFQGLTSFHQQLQYCRNNFNMIEPRRIVLKETAVQRLSGKRRKVIVDREEMMYIPLLETLQTLLRNVSVLKEVDDSHQLPSTELLGDYCDGKKFREHLLFTASPSALQLMVYYDELELCNPLGSRRKKHKIGAFYYLLGNLSPHFRSKIHNIQLLLLAKYSTVSEFGIDRMLEPIVEDIRKLESENGVPFVINGATRHFRGTITIVSADNPASTLLGGFKQSASAFRCCRHCLGSEEDIQSKFLESQFEIRSNAKHSDLCDLLERDDLSATDRQHYSLVYGINRRALLSTLSFFDVASGSLVPDIMHDVLEGALPREVKLMLQVYVMDQKLFSLDYIDSSFKKLNLRPFDGDRPSPLKGISLGTCDSNLHQHAMQMWTLGRFLPLVIGHLVPEDDQYWDNFLCLLDVMDILFARPVTPDACALAEVLISDHHSKFKDLYPHVSITLKMHSMIHMPRLMLEFGPLINHWTTRFEAKHKYFKHLANVMGNFTNICYSLALRHQLHQCYLMLNSHTLSGEKIEIGPGETVECSLPFWNSSSVLPSSAVFRANWVILNGTKYQMPCVLIAGKTEDEDLIFGNVVSIFVHCQSVLFEVEILNSHFCPHHHAHAVSVLPSALQTYLIKHSNLACYHPYGLYYCPHISSDLTLRYTVIRCNIYP